MKKLKEPMMAALAVIVVVLFIGMVVTLFFVEIPKANGELVYALAGMIGTGFITILNWFFGSSKGSSDKTDIIAKNGK